MATGRESHGSRRRQARALGENADEADNTSSHRLFLERVLRDQILNFAALANNDLGDKRKSACHFGACLSLGHWLPNDERARRADIDGTQVL
jgi:hypothetical protein